MPEYYAKRSRNFALVDEDQVDGIMVPPPGIIDSVKNFIGRSNIVSHKGI